jgi:hypothetical protein
LGLGFKFAVQAKLTWNSPISLMLLLQIIVSLAKFLFKWDCILQRNWNNNSITSVDINMYFLICWD